jgi:hypothetical protein
LEGAQCPITAGEKIVSKKINQIRQGDVLLVAIPAPKTQTRVLGEGDVPLAGMQVDGERTGHAHRLPARVYDTPEHGRVVFLERPETLRHTKPDGTQADHRPVEVPAGWWKVIVQREYAPRRNVSRSRRD